MNGGRREGRKKIRLKEGRKRGERVQKRPWLQWYNEGAPPRASFVLSASSAEAGETGPLLLPPPCPVTAGLCQDAPKWLLSSSPPPASLLHTLRSSLFSTGPVPQAFSLSFSFTRLWVLWYWYSILTNTSYFLPKHQQQECLDLTREEVLTWRACLTD